MSEIERINGRFAPGVSGNPGGKRRPDPTAKEIQSLAARMAPAVLLKLRRIVDAADETKPTTAVVKAAELILNRAHGLPVPETERMLFDGAQGDEWRIAFDMSSGAPEPLALEAGDDDPPGQAARDVVELEPFAEEDG